MEPQLLGTHERQSVQLIYLASLTRHGRVPAEQELDDAELVPSRGQVVVPHAGLVPPTRQPDQGTTEVRVGGEWDIVFLLP